MRTANASAGGANGDGEMPALTPILSGEVRGKGKLVLS